MTINAAGLIRVETAHDAAQTIRPVAGAERATCTGLTLNNEISDRDGGI
jgi:hypothetical protein